MSLRGDDEIDSLLAMMGGADSTAVTASTNSSKKEQEGKKRKKKKSKKGKKECKPKSHLFTKSRLDQNCFCWPQSKTGDRCLTLKSGLAHDCTGYTPSSDGAYGSKCRSCGKSAASHELCVKFDDNLCKSNMHIPYNMLGSIFVAVRNIRCILGEYCWSVATTSQAVSLIPSTNSVQAPTNMITKRLDLFQGKSLSELRKLETRRLPSINDNDILLLKEKAQSTIKSVTSYKHAITTMSSDINTIDCRLEAMASCDMLYYRCYYTCITSLHNSDDDGTVDLLPFIPHPPTYFSCPGLAWDALDSGKESLNIFLGRTKADAAGKYAAPIDNVTKSILMDMWSLKSRLDNLSDSNDNPLLSLWQSRFMETIRHVWCTGYSYEATRSALKKNIDTKTSNNADATELPHNQTIAVWRDSIWRDSLRDYPANFYSYACPTKSSLEAIIGCIHMQSEDQKCIEAGAGTGYWSALTNAKERLVIPYDIAPPSQSTPNLYHGEIPSFTTVENASSFDISKMKAFHESASVLLLCYPPPANDMAFSSLSTHLKYGGSNVVHIGEWQGLTGNTEFENLLTVNFACVHSELLPLWGTDATYLTIWNKRGSKKSDKPELISPAIGYCSAQPCHNAAERRCRFARCLQYCSEACFEKHATSRRSYLAIHMVHMPADTDLGFDNDNHFVQLQSESTDKRSKKKRKRNDKKR